MKRLVLALLCLAMPLNPAFAADLTAKLENVGYEHFIKAVDEAFKSEVPAGYEAEAGYLFPAVGFDVEPSPYLTLRDEKGTQVAYVQPSNAIHLALSRALVTALNEYLGKEFAGVPVQLTSDPHGPFRVQITELDRKAGTTKVKFLFPPQKPKAK